MEAPSPVSLDLSSSVLTLQLARNEWAWITVFGTSRVQSGLCLDRQLETSSAWSQTLWEEEMPQKETFSSCLR